MSIIRKLSILVVALALTAGCSTGGAADSNSHNGEVRGGPGIDLDNKVVHIGNISALSGPAALINKPMVAGMEAFWAASNARGGIDGWTIDFKVHDSAYQTQQHIQVYNQIRQEVALLGSFGSSATLAIRKQIDRDKLVTIPQAFDSLWASDTTLVPVGTPTALDAMNAIEYVIEKRGDAADKIGLLYQNDEAGADAVRGFDEALGVYDFTSAGKEAFLPGDTDFTGQVQRLKNAGATTVVVHALPTAAATIVGTAETLGFSPQWVFMGPAFIENLMTDGGVAGAKPTPVAPALEGVIVTTFAAPWGDKSVPGMPQMISDQKKYAPKQNPSFYFTYGYAQGMLQSKILAQAINSGDMSREGILKVRRNIGEVDLEGLVSAVTYGSTPDFASRASLIQEIDSKAPAFLRTLSESFLGKAARGYAVP